LRQLAVKYLPPSLIHQPKRGFEIPLKDWVNNTLKETVFDYLLSTDNFYSNFVEEKFVTDLLHEKVRIPGEKRAKILWALLSLEIWYKKVYKNNF
jgi:asparagine synthase (glutamine-hydrolysing)